MKRTAIVYDPFHTHHTYPHHPENHRRVEETWALLQEDSILKHLIQVPSSPAPREAILRVHTPEYLERLEYVALTGGGHLDGDTYVTADSYEAALRAAGGLLNVTGRVLRGEADNAFALVRPPGHHALVNQGMGFCLLANVAIAARWAQDQFGVDRVLIVDFDVHHGNGTQDVFYADPSVLFFSTHQFPYYPGTGAAGERGAGPGVGTTVNVPLPPGVGDAGYLEAFRRILMPVARRFRPELILLSAGFDAHWQDPLAGMRLSIAGYAQLTAVVMELAEELCQGRLVAVLEGGYNLEVLAHNVLSSLRLLRGEADAVSDPFGPAPGAEREVAPLLEQLRRLHRLEDPPFYAIPH
ncbi:histone deacetylase [Litorilinea aerophila]|uniref:Histone deacetylase n=1 Tax=Litorilinea aerophila TaxID=1204385 RepID=A0A540VF66_9CHLR|nr:histone deacetylase [Litorilinea aerophila]MCC9076908.1 histone deacetylase [Litorilinea aerophila]GIV78484.1 MAG: histone deacetylase [Litorilinea sp.]